MKASNKKEQKKSWFVDDDSDNDNADGNDQKEVTARDAIKNEKYVKNSL